MNEYHRETNTGMVITNETLERWVTVAQAAQLRPARKRKKKRKQKSGAAKRKLRKETANG